MNHYFHIDALSLILLSLVAWVGISVALFSRRHMKGDGHYRRYFMRFAALLLAVSTMILSDHILLFLAAWGVSNLLLVRLMIHKSNWRAAYMGGLLAAKYFLAALCLLATGFFILAYHSGTTSIQHLLTQSHDAHYSFIALSLIAIAAMIQAGIWPFHRWLLSSLNSPTPVSAMMHAGLVNGGGYLIVRLHSLYLQHDLLLQILLVSGMLVALLATLWKLIQPDIKRMLAASTISQMGFMIAQCGMGLFPAAIAHLCWHGLFKSYQFLNVGSSLHDKKMPATAFSATTFILALLAGVIGALVFAAASRKLPLSLDTTLILVIIAGLMAMQLALVVLAQNPFKRLPFALLLTALFSGFYGASVLLIERLLSPHIMMHPQPLTLLSTTIMLLLVVAWLSMCLAKNLTHSRWQTLASKIYVKCLNASQPHPATITAHRNHYQYK